MTQQNTKILVVEDDPNLGFILQESLELQRYAIVRCENGLDALDEFLNQSFDLCLIDVMLPVMDGFTLAEKIREHNKLVPIIFLTAKSLKEDRIEGFKIGGDDYVTKPFSMEELLLRIQAVLKRTQNQHSKNNSEIFHLGRYIFDYSKQLLIFNNENYKLSFKESELLYLLSVNKNQLLKRKTALDKIWEDDSYFTARSMDVYISKLRGFLKKDERIEIKNLHGKGYKMMIKE